MNQHNNLAPSTEANPSNSSSCRSEERSPSVVNSVWAHRSSSQMDASPDQGSLAATQLGTLIIFTRYPIAGQTKTRLIPALGAAGAADLQRQMTERTLMTVETLMRQWSSGTPEIQPEIRFSGGALSDMQQWLGQQWCYSPQGPGDLGDRLNRAFQAAFTRGAQWAIAIGIDCPEITPEILKSAIDCLKHHDLVLGPATDGGYYLIGLSRFVPQVFEAIDWGTDQVLQQTLDCAGRLQLRTTQLDPLSDVDRPEDLHIWRQAFANHDLSQPVEPHKGGFQISDSQAAPQSARSCLLSIIVPVLNEVGQIDTLLKHLKLQALDANRPTGSTSASAVSKQAPFELVVVDGGSHDATCEKLRRSGVRVLSTPPGRAKQMNQGAQIARGEILLFLHADTRLPLDFIEQIQAMLSTPGHVAGAFTLKIDHAHWGFRVVEWGVKWRSRLFQLPYGDQGLFMKKATFEAIGGFRDLPIMEDYEIVRRLKTLGTVAIAPSPVITSSRRWQRLGIVQTTLLNQIIVLAYHLGISPQHLNRWYRGKTPP